MPVTKYQYDTALDTAEGITHIPPLTAEIDADATLLAGGFSTDHIDVNIEPGKTDIYMSDLLPALEEEALDAVVAAHTGVDNAPDQGASGGNMLVFQDGSAADGPVVFGDWTALIARLNAIRDVIGDSAVMEIVVDDTVTQPAVMPAGAYDLSSCLLRGISRAGQFGHSQINIGEGVTITGLYEFVNIDIRCLATETSPITVLNGDVFLITDGSDISAFAPAAVGLFDASGLDSGLGEFWTIRMRTEGSIGGQGQAHEIVDCAGSILLVELFSGSILQKNSVESDAAGMMFVSMRAQDSLLGPQPGFVGTLDKNFGDAVKGPRFNTTGAVRVGAENLTIGVGFVLADVSGGGFTLTLPNMPNASFDNFGQPIIVKEVGNAVGLVVAADATDTLDGVPGGTVDIGAGGCAWFMPDGAGAWHLAASY